jgi:hypothetical protein
LAAEGVPVEIDRLRSTDGEPGSICRKWVIGVETDGAVIPFLTGVWAAGRLVELGHRLHVTGGSPRCLIASM